MKETMQEIILNAEKYHIIRKEMRINGETLMGDQRPTIVGVEINTQGFTVEPVWMGGPAPDAKNLIMALLSDKDVRRMIKVYQQVGRKYPFHIWRKDGMSGCEDYFVIVGKPNRGFYWSHTKKLIHVSCYGKANEGVDPIYIGDLVELAVAMGLAENLDVRYLRKKSGMKYIPKKDIMDLEMYFQEGPTKIL